MERVASPSALFRQVLAEHKVTPKEAAPLIGITEVYLRLILNGHKRITPLVAMGVEKWLGAECGIAKLLIATQALYDFEFAKNELAQTTDLDRAVEEMDQMVSRYPMEATA